MESTIAEYLAGRRSALGMTQEALALIVGVHRETISRYERGENTPNSTILDALLRALDVPPIEQDYAHRLAREQRIAAGPRPLLIVE